EFGAAAFQIYSPYSYDATMVLAKAMEKAGSVEPAKYLKFVQKIDYSGVTKKDIHFEKNGNLADPTITLSAFDHGTKKVVAVEQVK
ncbi:MAG: branched-chain amino acid ABC transporter substrate-binding protein, partial [Betaproteobacteria bacterium]|nr:branched-chain amino acid ABC transporter substrate-binding protein [Betaproteobacteria bacterium]